MPTGYHLLPEELEAVINRIVDAVHPFEVIAFGSRARGEQHPDSDLDLAVIVDGDEAAQRSRLYGVTKDLDVPVDLLTISRERYDRFRPWINTVHRQIDREGVRLYERGRQSADRAAFDRLCEGSKDARASA